MQVSDEGVRDFQRIWKEDYGEEITIEFARTRAAQVLDVILLLRAARKRTTAPQPPSS